MNHSIRKIPTVDWLVEGGEAGAIIRSKDWSQTPLGSIEQWSQSLKTTLNICLSSQFATVMYWGSEYVQFYNDAARFILGQKHPRSLGQTCQECWSEIWDEVEPLLSFVMTTGEAPLVENRLLTVARHGFEEEVYWTFNYTPVRDERGEIAGIITVAFEVSQQIFGDRRAQTLAMMAANGSEAVSVEEAYRNVMQPLCENPKDVPFALLYGLDTESSKPGTVRLLQTVGIAPEDLMLPSVLKLGNGWQFEQVLQSGRSTVVTDLSQCLATVPAPEGMPSPHSAIVLPLVVSGQTEIGGFLVAGLSPMLRLNEDYQRFFELVARQVAAAITNATAHEEEQKRTAALAELDRAKTTFFSNVSHELRTPLTLILGSSEALLNDSNTRLETQQQQLEVVHRNAERLLKLVNTLLDFSRIEAGRIQANYEPIDLATYTADLASVFRSAIESAGMQLIVDCPPLPEAVYVDREMWEKIVLNLLSNAFKFTFEGAIAVRLNAINNSVQLIVSDTGTGIAAEELSHLFERFYRIKGAQGRSYEGSGIGLSLVQELVKLHGGQIEVNSAVNQGTTFTITIPMGYAHLPAEQIGTPSSQASTAIQASAYVGEALRWLPHQNSRLEDTSKEHSNSKHQTPKSKILLVDDNADMRDYVKRLLENDYTVEAVNDGQAALTAIQAHRPDLVLSDVMMPGIDGFELLQTLRANPETREIPIILLSARAGEESRVEGLTAGADDYLIKPFSARELLARVDGNVRLGQMRREAALRKLNEILEQQVQERTAQLKAANKELDAFSYSVSHDLRAPLRRINGLIQILQDDLLDRRPEIAEYIALITQTTQEADTLIESMLSFSRMIRSDLCRISFSMAELVQTVQADLQSDLQHRSIEWQISPLPEVYGDPVLLRLVWQNLLSNAVKYTRSRAHARITIAVTETAHEQIFSVRDNGVGFDMNRVDRLFGIFQRLHSADEFEGTGIGLANVQRIIHRHQGRVWAEAELDRGATFYFSLPKSAIDRGA